MQTRTSEAAKVPLHFHPQGGDQDDWREPPAGEFDGRKPEVLPFRVELWNETRTAIDHVLAITANASIGYAAFYAATKEFPERYITLTHRKGIVTSWNGPTH